MKYAVLVCGPAGAGKSTFCSALLNHAASTNRSMHLFNLDPAAENFGNHTPSVDIRDLIGLEDVMEDLDFGPNGGLIYCFECAARIGAQKALNARKDTS
jgi:GTPase SAR1 family protein